MPSDTPCSSDDESTVNVTDRGDPVLGRTLDNTEAPARRYLV